MSLDQKRILEYIDNDDLESLALCAQNGMDVTKLIVISELDWQPYFPLFYSICKKKERISLFLIENGADVHYINSQGDSAAQFACRYNQVLTLKALIDKNAPLNQPNLKCYDLPIGKAIHAENLEALELIASHLHYETLDWAITVATQSKPNLEIVKILEAAIRNLEPGEK